MPVITWTNLNFIPLTAWPTFLETGGPVDDCVHAIVLSALRRRARPV